MNQKHTRQATPQANLTEDIEVFCAVTLEVNMVSKSTEWILNTGATRHFWANKDLMHDFEDVPDGEYVFMGDVATALVMGKWKVLLKFTFGKSLCLNNVLFVPSLHRNLVLSSPLDIVGFEVNHKAEKIVILLMGSLLVRVSYGGLFVPNVASDVVNGNASTSTYIVESVDLWHGRLGHVNYASINKLRNVRLIPNINTGNCSNGDVCVEAKFAKKPFKSITTRKTELLELVHLDLAEFKNAMSKGGRKWYIAFVDDYSKYTKVYLIKSKDDAEEMFVKYKTEVENQLDRKIKRFRSDRVGEYDTSSLTAFCEKKMALYTRLVPLIPLNKMA